ncbi:hypothetical protein A1OE_382 [Candidatus Endolissoclinum faulkneri L2]|uniref:Uncharacterized protein n=1 Tax=Candidatus Endolissoclinum faulkneri L2 TaxID=1193729 RepID=K7YM49_9PROT|nr:hypothetical protein A1OE_382 [Candidatus Endolissoclinum faulkneri L2]
MKYLAKVLIYNQLRKSSNLINLNLKELDNRVFALYKSTLRSFFYCHKNKQSLNFNMFIKNDS